MKDLIGLMTGENANLLVGLLGILKAGCGFVPIDPTYPLERIQFMVNDCGIEILVTESRYLDQAWSLAESNPSLRHVICLDDQTAKKPKHVVAELHERQDWLRRQSANEDRDGGLDQLVYVIYTSGSTGHPKGVPITHRNLVPLLLWSREYFSLGEHTRVLQNLSYCFDFGVFELLTTVLFGGTLYFAGRDRSDKLLTSAAFVNEHAINTIHTTPSYFREITSAGARLESLEILHLGGEQLTKSTVDAVFEVVGENCQLYNGYGPTEASVNCSIMRVGCKSEVGTELHQSAPIGRVTANNELYVLDKKGEPVPVGVGGELHVGGPGLSYGYLNRKSLTAEKFIPNTFVNEPGARLYKTGDLVRYRPDGDIEFLGRLDHQVKIRGYRIEVGEIEQALIAHPSVAEAVVTPHDDATGMRRLVAYVIDKHGESTTASELRSFLKKRLPDYMVPSAFVKLEALPLTTSGKIDRKALPAPDQSRPELDEVFAAPRTSVEEIIAGICAEVLGLDRVGVHDDLFELGCHSLLAAKIVVRIRESLGVELALTSIFETPTVAELAVICQDLNLAGASLQLPPIEPVARNNGHLQLSFEQERIWFLDQLTENNISYYIPRALRIKGDFSLAVLERTFTELVRRHEILRTGFTDVNGQPVQIINPPQPFKVNFIDLTDLNGEKESEVKRLVLAEGQKLFSLDQPPLVRVTLIQLDKDDFVLAVTEHHLVHDGWTQGVLLAEFLKLYPALAAGKSSPLPDLPFQYADFAAWQRKCWQGEFVDAQVSYWKKQLAGAPPVLELPTDHVRPAVQTFRGGEQRLEISAELANSLRELSRREGVTLFMTMLAVFKVLLSRYAGHFDIVVGTPIANRRCVEVEGMLGMIVNTVILRTDLSGDLTVRELLKRVRKVCLESYAHQDMPFEKLVEVLQPQRSLSHQPIFQVMFGFLNTPMRSLEIPGMTLELIDSHNHSAKFDLNVTFMLPAEQRIGLNLGTAEGEITGIFEYNTDLYEAETISRMLGHYHRLLESVLQEPETLVSELQLLTESEAEQLQVGWNETAVSYPSECIHELFEAQVERTPAAVALVFAEQQLKYGELNERANQLAHYLRAQGVGPETLVAILLERSVELVVGLLGVLKAGGAYVPIDPEYPRERVKYMLADCGARVLLTTAALATNVEGCTVVALDSEWEQIAEQSELNPKSLVSVDNLAYVIYTSGSTGQPKGAMNTHRALCNRLLWMQQTYQLNAEDRVLQKTSVSFDVSVWEFFWPLITGARLVLAQPGGQRDGAYLVQLMAQEQITTTHFVPSMLEVFLQEQDVERCDALKRVICSGEAMSLELQQRFFARLAVPLENLYGPTEAAIDVSRWSCEPESNRRVVPIGKPIANLQLYVLDEAQRLVPVGVTGELYIGGVGVGRGYLRRAGLTAERFVPDPFSSEAGARLYRTGDQVRLARDGNIEYLGRADGQVKLRGFRIELGEIEAALLQHEQIREAVVVARKDAAGEQRLVAYVVAKDAGLKISELRHYLQEKLPSYMVPAAFVELERMPLSPNGKVDRRALPEPEADRAALAVEYAGPRTAVEENLVNIWSEVLSVAQVGVHDNFFDLGGHSLLGTQVISRVRQAFSIELPLRALFEAPTVTAMARLVEAAPRVDRGTVATQGLALERVGDLPLSFAQQRMWFIDQLEPGNPTYNMAAAVRLSGLLDVPALERALSEVVRRHEALRTTFPTVDGAPVQWVAAASALPLSLVELSEFGAELQAEREVERLANEEAERPFDLSTGPLFRAQLLRVSEAEHVVLVTVHHIVSDGWSMNVLIREVVALYEAYSSGQESPLPELPIQYADYAAWQRDWLSGEVLEQELTYWREQLAGAPPVLELPTDQVRPAVQTFRGGEQRMEISTELANSLSELSRREGVTLFMTLLAAFKTLLYRYSGQTSVVVGTPIAGRTQVEVEELIGFFVNTLVLRTEVDGELSFVELLQRVKEVALGAYAHQDMPFEKLVEVLQPQRSLSHTPLFQVMFGFLNAPMRRLEMPGMTLELIDSHNHSAKFDLNVTFMLPPEQRIGLNLGAAEGEITGIFEYNTDLYEAETISRMLGHYQQLLESVLREPETPIAALELLTGNEAEQLQVAWNETAVSYPSECIHELFEAQVARTPAAVALVFAEQQLKYGELNERANQLAHYLRAQGVGPETLVAILLERSVELVVSLLGVLKAGGAYVPIDPEYPRERVHYMLADCGARVLLTTAALAMTVEGCAVVALDSEWEQIAEQSEANPKSLVSVDNLAYVIYTSGSTGQPKGAMNTHRALCNRLLWGQQTYQLTADDRVLQKTSVSFDVSVWEFFWPLITGARLVLAQPGGQRDGAYLVQLMAQEQITTTHFVPSMLEVFLQEQDVERCDALKRVICSGEAMSLELQQRFFARLAVPLENLYGPTEAAIEVSRWSCEPESKRRVVPIGKPIANLQLYVLDEAQRLVPVGVTGELYIGGVGVARGYLRRAGLTAERFVPDPYSSEAGARLYRTGDQVRLARDGNIEYLGRADGQVKLRGFRIELGEIEAALLQHEQIREAVVMARKDAAGEQRLVAYFVAAGELQVSELRRTLGEKLPSYMVPAAFVELERMPLNPNGKVDRRALPEPEVDRAALAVEYAAPRTAVEETLVNIWSEVLGVPQVGIHDNFFDLGGHSLLATQVMARISKTFQAELPLRRLFEQPTIAVLAAAIEQSREQEKGRAVPRIPARRKARSVEQLVTEVTQFSDTEVESLLQAGGSSSSQAVAAIKGKQ